MADYGRRFGLWPVFLLLFAVLGVGAWLAWNAYGPGAGDTSPGAPHLAVSLDTRGPYLILASRKAQSEYAQALDIARELHPGAEIVAFDPADLSGVRDALARIKPRYALILLLPGELDVNFAWAWLRLAVAVDDDPFVDVAAGFVTGSTPEAAAALLQRTRDALEGKTRIPAALVDDLGANPQADPGMFSKTRDTFFLPAFKDRMHVATISHGVRGFGRDRLDSLAGAGIVHFGGHGYPDRIVDSLNGPFVRQVPFDPCLIFNGACYTGVVGRWFDTTGGRVQAKEVEPGNCFALGVLENRVVAYLAALHPDHGIPVYQEMEYMAWSGESLGYVMKHTHDGVVLGFGGELPPWADLAPGQPVDAVPAWIMLRGTASRVLYGDPSLVVGEAFAEPPLDIRIQEGNGRLKLRAVVHNTLLRATFTDTYYSDLSAPRAPFNDRALVSADLPPGWDAVALVEVAKIRAPTVDLPFRLVGWALEKDADGTARLHVLVDVPATGYMQSALRQPGVELEINVSAY